MYVLVVLVVHMHVVVIQRLVNMKVVMLLPEQQCHPHCHQDARADLLEPERLRQDERGEQGARERSHREHRGLASCAQRTERERVRATH